MIDTLQSFTPDWVSPPGETIADLLEERDWTQAQLAERLGYTTKHISQLINGKAPVTEETALKLERVLGSTAAFWLNREAQYRAQLAKIEEQNLLMSWVTWLNELPVKELMHQGIIPKCRLDAKNKPGVVKELLTFFGVASPDDWRTHYVGMKAAFRQTRPDQCDTGAISALDTIRKLSQVQIFMSYKIERGVLIPKDKLHPNPWNPNHMKPRQQEAVSESIKHYGQVMELLVRPHPEIEEEYQIIDGEHRYSILPDEVYCNVIHGLPDAEAKKLTIVMNETRGSADKIELAQLLSEIKDDLGDDLGLALPYEENELEELIKLSEVDWDQFEEDVDDPFEEEAEDGDNTEWNTITIKITNEALDVVNQAKDLIEEAMDNKVKDAPIQWGLILEYLAADYLGK